MTSSGRRFMMVCVVSLVRPVDAKVSVFEPMVPFLPRAVAAVDQSATPFTASTEVVPVRLPVLIETVTDAVEVVTVLPEAS